MLKKKILNSRYNNLNKKIISCTKCARLVRFRKKISKQRRKQYINETYWGKPITGFGDLNAKILIVGLAPAAHGGTRTGRVFTGDKSSDFLYKCLYSAKISNKPNSDNINEGLKFDFSPLHETRRPSTKKIPLTSVFTEPVNPPPPLGTGEPQNPWY